MAGSEETLEAKISITTLFHRLNRVLPDNQILYTLPPDLKVTEAIQKLMDKGYSQAPVVIGREVLGVFSFRSFARSLSRIAKEKAPKLDEIRVDDCLEKPVYARVSDEFNAWFDHLEQSDSILIGEPGRLQGIITAIDILRYLYGVASPFVLLAEIELALRALIRLCVTPADLIECARVSLAQLYDADRLPSSLAEMTFGDYIQVITDGRNWDKFSGIFGGTRQRVRARLEEIRDLRNDTFHFKRDLTSEDYEKLADHRDWLLLRATAAEARGTTNG